MASSETMPVSEQVLDRRQGIRRRRFAGGDEEIALVEPEGGERQRRRDHEIARVAAPLKFGVSPL